jgi:ABC-type uncharacterized transport system permease subunit
MHLLAMVLFSLFVAAVFGVVTKETPREQVLYGLKVFFAFMGIGLALAWVMFPIS